MLTIYIWIIAPLVASTLLLLFYWYFRFKRKDIKNKGEHICKICGRDGYQKSKTIFDGKSFDTNPAWFFWEGNECPDCKRLRHFTTKKD